MARSASVVLAGLCRLASAEAEALSLLQHAVHAQRPHLSGALPGELAAEGKFMGGFFLCNQVQAGVESGCSELQSSAEHPNIAERSVRHIGSESSCASFTSLAGADSFNFEKDQRCQPLTCNSIDMKFVPGQGASTVYSLYCGMRRVNSIVEPAACGYTQLGYQVFSHPPARACDNELKFESVGRNNLDTGGALVFKNVLSGTDLSITASAGYEPKIKGVTGVSDGFGLINMHGGEVTTFTFQFLKSGTTDPMKVDMFTFTIADLQVVKTCIFGQMSVTANDFAGYYLENDPHVDVKVFPGNATSAPSANFRAIADGEQEPTDGTLRKPEARRSISLFYKDRSSFELKADVSAAAGGRNLKFGGGLLMTCNGPH